MEKQALTGPLDRGNTILYHGWDVFFIMDGWA
jgi:hypothetical protein